MLMVVKLVSDIFGAEAPKNASEEDKVMIVGIIVKKMEFFCMEIKSNTKFDKVESVSNFGFKKSCRIHFAKKIVSYPISNLNKIVNY